MAVQLSLTPSLNKEEKTPSEIVFDLDTFKDKGYLTHNFHPYPAKFVPQIPRYVIQALSRQGGRVLDPFCGSGTTLVEANILGRSAIGFDLNPLAGLISSVKTTPLNPQQLKTVETALLECETFLRAGMDKKVLQEYSTYIPDFRNRDHWFRPHVQLELAYIRKLIVETTDELASRFLRVALSAVVVKVSNQDSDTRWVAVEKDIRRGDTLRAFSSKASDMLARIKRFAEVSIARSEIYSHTLTENDLSSESVDLVVTSPPYLNSFDYYLYHKLRFFWLGLDHYIVQAKETGSRHRHCDKGEGIEAYTSEILTVMRVVHSKLRKGRHLCIVIGDSILNGELIDMKVIYESLGKQAGFAFVHSFSYDQRRYTSSFTRNLKNLFKRTHIMFFVSNK